MLLKFLGIKYDLQTKDQGFYLFGKTTLAVQCIFGHTVQKSCLPYLVLCALY